MKLTIKTIFGERTFELSEPDAIELIELAERASSDLPKLAPVVERPPVIETEVSVDAANRGYKGFLHIKCEKCGTVKGYCTSRPLHYHRCNCRHHTPLFDLAPVRAKCKCGEFFTYMTNIVDPQFTMNCMSCGSPIELELDDHGTAYVTVED